MRTAAETRRSYLERHSFELLIAVLSLITALSFGLDPDTLRQTAIGRELAGWDYVWTTAYGFGGLLIILGLWLPRPRVEVVGLLMLCAAVAIYAIAVWQVAGSVGTAAVASYIAIFAACAGRVRQMFRVSKDAS